MTNQIQHKKILNGNESITVYSTYCSTSDNKTLLIKKVSNKYPHYLISNIMEILNTVIAYGWIPKPIKAEVSDNLTISSHQSKFAKTTPN